VKKWENVRFFAEKLSAADRNASEFKTWRRGRGKKTEWGTLNFINRQTLSAPPLSLGGRICLGVVNALRVVLGVKGKQLRKGGGEEEVRPRRTAKSKEYLFHSTNGDKGLCGLRMDDWERGRCADGSNWLGGGRGDDLCLSISGRDDPLAPVKANKQ